MNILITGGAGFIGTKLAQTLKDDHRVLIVDNFIKQVHGYNPTLIQGVEYIFGDITTGALSKCKEFDPEVIFHLASETGTAQSMDEMSRYINTNVTGAAALLENVKQFKNLKKIVLTSTRAVYGEKLNISEHTTEYTPVSLYGLSKLFQEQLIKLCSHIPYVIYRYQNVYGPGQSLTNPHTGILCTFFNRLKNNKDIEIYDNGVITRDFVYIDDVVDATLLSLKSGVENVTYNVGSGVETKLVDIANIIKKELNSTGNIIICNKHRDGDILRAKGCIDAIKRDHNWSPKVNIKTGISRLVRTLSKLES